MWTGGGFPDFPHPFEGPFTDFVGVTGSMNAGFFDDASVFAQAFAVIDGDDSYGVFADFAALRTFRRVHDGAVDDDPDVLGTVDGPGEGLFFGDIGIITMIFLEESCFEEHGFEEDGEVSSGAGVVGVVEHEFFPQPYYAAENFLELYSGDIFDKGV